MKARVKSGTSMARPARFEEKSGQLTLKRQAKWMKLLSQTSIQETVSWMANDQDRVRVEMRVFYLWASRRNHLNCQVFLRFTVIRLRWSRAGLTCTMQRQAGKDHHSSNKMIVNAIKPTWRYIYQIIMHPNIHQFLTWMSNKVSLG